MILKIKSFCFNLQLQKVFYMLLVTVSLFFFADYFIAEGGRNIAFLRKFGKSPLLIEDILLKRMIQPSKKEYNNSADVTDKISVIKATNAISSYMADVNSFWIDAVIGIETFVPKTPQRYFLEYNAGDGVTNSGTLHLEKFLNWTGLLIESDVELFNMLKQVQRKSYIINACLKFNSIENSDLCTSLMTRYSKYKSPKNHNYRTYNIFNLSKMMDTLKHHPGEDTCFALEHILEATNIKALDLFILKLSKNHLETLQLLPFGSVEVSFFAIEVVGVKEKNLISLHKFLDSKGYIFYDKFRFGNTTNFSMFILKDYYKDEEVEKKAKNMSLLSNFKILVGNTEKNIDEDMFKKFIMFNDIYGLQPGSNL